MLGGLSHDDPACCATAFDYSFFRLRFILKLKGICMFCIVSFLALCRFVSF